MLLKLSCNFCGLTMVFFVLAIVFQRIITCLGLEILSSLYWPKLLSSHAPRSSSSSTHTSHAYPSLFHDILFFHKQSLQLIHNSTSIKCQNFIGNRSLQLVCFAQITHLTFSLLQSLDSYSNTNASCHRSHTHTHI